MVAAAKFIHREMPEPQVIMTVINIMGPPVVMAAGRSLAGCLDWSNWHCRPIYIGKVGNRAVFGRAGADLNLRSRLFTDGDLGVGLLLRLDFLPRCRVYIRVCASVWLTPSYTQRCSRGIKKPPLSRLRTHQLVMIAFGLGLV